MSLPAPPRLTARIRFRQWFPGRTIPPDRAGARAVARGYDVAVASAAPARRNRPASRMSTALFFRSQWTGRPPGRHDRPAVHRSPGDVSTRQAFAGESAVQPASWSSRRRGRARRPPGLGGRDTLPPPEPVGHASARAGATVVFHVELRRPRAMGRDERLPRKSPTLEPTTGARSARLVTGPLPQRARRRSPARLPRHDHSCSPVLPNIAPGAVRST